MSDNVVCPSNPTTSAAHCWHSTMRTLTSNPPQNVEQCCFCGQTRNIVVQQGVFRIGHGPHLPRLG